MLLGDLKCLNLLLESDNKSVHQWQYFINQPGTTLPIIRVEDISKQLHQLRGPCDPVVTSHQTCSLDSIYSIHNTTFDLRFENKFVLRYVISICAE